MSLFHSVAIVLLLGVVGCSRPTATLETKKTTEMTSELQLPQPLPIQDGWQVEVQLAALDEDRFAFFRDVIAVRLSGMSSEKIAHSARTIVVESHRYGLDPYLVLALIETESRYYNAAQSSVGARGLMQIRPFVAKALAAETGIVYTDADDLFKPATNIALGCYFLHKLKRRYGGNVEHALAAYNNGPTKVSRILKQRGELTAQTRRYPRKVKNALRRLLLEWEHKRLLSKWRQRSIMRCG